MWFSGFNWLDVYCTFVLYSLSCSVFIAAAVTILSQFQVPRPSSITARNIFVVRNSTIAADHSEKYNVIAHRGGGDNILPENSLEAIRNSCDRGFKMVEFDVRTTKDSYAVLFHDDTLLRVLGKQRIPTLKQAVALCMDLGIRFIIDVKDDDERLIGEILDIFMSYGERIYSMGVISSFNFSVVYKVRARNPKIIGALAWRPSHFALPITMDLKTSSAAIAALDKIFSAVITPIVYQINDFCMLHVYWWLIGLSAILVHKDALNIELVSKLQSRGVYVFAWTVNCPLEKEFIAKKLGIGYLTDKLDVSY